MTLTFLILAGQVKVKGQLGEMAKCLEDGDVRIRDLSRMFFTELSTKDNAIYNHFVDMFSLLSAEKGLEEDSLRKIIKFLAGFIEKVWFPQLHLIFIRCSILTSSRINTPNSLQISWQPDLQDAIPRDNGMTLLTHSVCCSIKTRRS